MGLKQQDQFKTIVNDLAKSLAANSNAPWEKVKILFSYCPQLEDDHFVIQPYSLDCIIGLGTYFIESGFSHTEKIVPYLLNLLKGLILAKWFDDLDSSKTPYAEKFAFCLNTLLSEVSNTVKQDIFIYQTNEIANIYTNLMVDVKNGFSSIDAEKHFFAVKLPVFLGLTQSMTRYCTEEKSFFCYLFPKYKDYVGITHHIKSIYESPHINLVSLVCKQANQMFPNPCIHTFTRKRCDYSSANVINTLKIVQSLLSIETLKQFEVCLSERNYDQLLEPYYFKHLDEILTCVALILYRDILHQKTDLTTFISNSKDFIDLIFLSTQKCDLLSYVQTRMLDQEDHVFQRLKINVLIKILCLELLVSSVKDTYEAENLCAYVTTALKGKHINKNVVLINAPYTVACMNVLGTLADRYFVLSNTCIKALQDFLSSPSSTLKNLCTDSVPIEADLYMKSNKLISKEVWFEYCIFKKVQNSAIENLCTSLKSTYNVDQNYIPAFLTKFSSLLFIEKHQPDYELIIENVVVTLGHMSYSLPSLSLAILQCFQQRLCRHSIESDIAIIHQLGNMLIFNTNMNVFLGTLKIFSNMMFEVFSDADGKLQHISTNLFNVLFNVAERIHECDKISTIYCRFFEIFVQVGLDELRNSEIPDALKNNIKSNLLHLIGLLSVKFQCNNTFKKQQERLFEDFWLYFVLSRKDSLILEYCDDLKAIVQKFPTLTSESLTDHDLREFFYTSSLNKLQIPASKQNQLKTFILNFLENTSENSVLVNKLTFPQIIYIYSVCALENIRIENSQHPSIEFLFCYLTNLKLQKDKYNIWQCICKVAEQIFNRFLDSLLIMERNDARELVLEKQVQILLINFNNIHSQVRHIADKFLSELISVFPHLLWNQCVIWSVFDIVAVLNYSIIIDANDQVTSLNIPNTDFSIFLMDTKKSREDVFNDFVARSKEIISEARKWAPTIVSSHIQEYITQYDYLFPKIDPMCQLRHCAWTLVCSNETSFKEVSDVIISMTIRSKFIGEVTGLIEKSNLSTTNFGKSLAEDVWKACSNKDLSNYQICLQRITAFAITQQTLQFEIKKVLAGSYIIFFTEETISTAVHCWNWLCTVRPNFELEFLMEMFEMWQYTIDNRMGLFCVENENKSKQMQIVSSESNSYPHNIWIEFITQQISSSKYAFQSKLEMIINFIHKTLPMNIGGSDCIMSRSVEYIVARFSLLSSTLSLLQYDIPVSRMDLVIIRQRVYCSCLDYFCCLRGFPMKTGLYLKHKIDVLVKFWNTLYSDKKHIMKQFPNRIKDFIDHSKENIVLSNDKRNDSFKDSYDTLISYDSFSLDIYNKRKLALCLLAEEIGFLSTWCEPVHNNSVNKIREWQAKLFSQNRSLSEFSKIAWEVSPILSVYLPVRLRRDERITSEISKLILKNPAAVSHIPHAMTFLATVDHIQNDCKELIHLLTWTETKPLQVLSLLSKHFHHPFVLQYAMKALSNVDVSDLVNFIPQLVQSLRYDLLDYVNDLLLKLCKTSQLFCHQLIWNIKSNMYVDINMTTKSSLFDKLNVLLDNIINSLTGPEKIFYEREFEFIDQITDVSSKIPRNLKRDEKKSACINALKAIKMCPGCYLPSSPDALICEMDYNSGTPLQSKARTPYLANFLVYRCSYNQVLDIGIKVSEKQLAGYQVHEIDCNDKTWYPKMWQRTIFKAADDVRQDVLALQTIQYLKSIFREIGLDVFLFPYKVVAVAPGMGVIECIPNASSRDQLGKQTNVGLYDYFVTMFGNEKSARFQEAQKNFIKSVAAYSLVIFLLQIKDRHNGNIMVDDEGRIIHIDFGFMFESSPGGNLGFEPDMKLTEEMLMIMGGGMDTEQFQWFTELCVKAYLAARCHQEEIITLVTLMLDSGLPGFRGQTIKLLRGRFAPNASEREAADYIITVIRNSCLNFRTVTYDMLQFLQNSIQY